jgi:rod shape-determining protein MreD
MSPAGRGPLLVALVGAGTVIDSAWLSRLPAAPDLPLLVLVSAALRGGLPAGALLGATTGYLRDLVGGGPLGLYTLAYLAVGIAAGSAAALIDFDSRVAPAATAAASSGLVHLVSAAVVVAAGIAVVYWPVTIASAAAEAALNALLARPVDRAVRVAERVLGRRQRLKALGYRVIR